MNTWCWEYKIDTAEFLDRLTESAQDKKAENIVRLDVRGMVSYADYFLIAGAASPRQVKAIAEAMLDAAKDAKKVVISIEGVASSKWILLDFGDVVAHLFHSPVRAFYDLEGLWMDAPRLPVPPPRENVPGRVLHQE